MFNGRDCSYACSRSDGFYRKLYSVNQPRIRTLDSYREYYRPNRLGIIGNLHLLFALAIGGSWAKEKAGGAFSAGLAFILINLITGHFFGVTTDMLADAAATVTTVLEQRFRFQATSSTSWVSLL